MWSGTQRPRLDWRVTRTAWPIAAVAPTLEGAMVQCFFPQTKLSDAPNAARSLARARSALIPPTLTPPTFTCLGIGGSLRPAPGAAAATATSAMGTRTTRRFIRVILGRKEAACAGFLRDAQVRRFPCASSGAHPVDSVEKWVTAGREPQGHRRVSLCAPRVGCHPPSLATLATCAKNMQRPNVATPSQREP